MALAGFGMFMTAASCNTIVQSIVEEDKRGRVMSYYTMFFIGSLPIGHLAAGALAERIGAPLTFLAGGISCALAGATFVARLRSFRDHLRPVLYRAGHHPSPRRAPPMTDTVLLERRGAAAIVTLNRPEKLNALDDSLMRDLDRVTREVAEDPAVRAVMLRGAGRAFMAGGDVAFFHANLGTLRERFLDMGQVFHASVRRLRTMEKPVLACVHGAVAGGGLSVMLACDLAIASRDAQLSLAYANIGTSPDGGSSFTLPRIVGMRKALELAFLGERLDADTACSLGLVNWVVDPAELESRANSILERLAAGPSFAYARTKALFNETWERTMAAQMDAELASFARCVPTRDFAEGTGAFVAKRTPEVHGQVTVPTLAGRTLFITGASRGIGREIALRAARDGANVAIAAKTCRAAPEAQGHHPHGRRRDRGRREERRSPSRSTCATRPPSRRRSNRRRGPSAASTSS